MENSCETLTIEKTPHNVTQIWKPKPKQTNNDRWTKTSKCLVVRGKWISLNKKVSWKWKKLMGELKSSNKESNGDPPKMP
jgi:hypothetical protein